MDLARRRQLPDFAGAGVGGRAISGRAVGVGQRHRHRGAAAGLPGWRLGPAQRAVGRCSRTGASVARRLGHRGGRGLRRLLQRGLGILLLAVLGALGHTDMVRMNGITNFVSAILPLMAVAIYAASDAIVWTHALWMALGATAGGYVGGTGARQPRPASCAASSF